MKKPVSISLDVDIIRWAEEQAEKTGRSTSNFINQKLKESRDGSGDILRGRALSKCPKCDWIGIDWTGVCPGCGSTDVQKAEV